MFDYHLLLREDTVRHTHTHTVRHRRIERTIWAEEEKVKVKAYIDDAFAAANDASKIK